MSSCFPLKPIDFSIRQSALYFTRSSQEQAFNLLSWCRDLQKLLGGFMKCIWGCCLEGYVWSHPSCWNTRQQDIWEDSAIPGSDYGHTWTTYYWIGDFRTFVSSFYEEVCFLHKFDQFECISIFTTIYLHLWEWIATKLGAWNIKFCLHVPAQAHSAVSKVLELLKEPAKEFNLYAEVESLLGRLPAPRHISERRAEALKSTTRWRIFSSEIPAEIESLDGEIGDIASDVRRMSRGLV